MTATQKKIIDLAPQVVPFLTEEQAEQVRTIFMTVKVEPDKNEEKPFRRTFGALANDDFYVAPDFDSCFDDDPALFGMEEYV